MEWTKEQTRAIETNGTDILVAAGAGSGKTAVLVERIMRSVFRAERPADVDSLLVVTFTRAAASEMRSRLSVSMDKMLENSDDPALAARVYDQQVRLQRAWITTIDSFCKRVLTENIKESGIDSSYAVCDESLREELLSAAIEDAAEKISGETPEEYSALVDIYGRYNSDAELLGYVKKTLEHSFSFPDPREWILRSERAFCEPFEDGDFLRTPWGRWLLYIIRLRFESLLGELQKLRGLCDIYEINNYAPALDSDIEQISELLNKIGSGDNITWTDAYDACAGLNFSKLKPAKKDEAEQRSEAANAAAEQIKNKRRAIKEEIKNKVLNRFFTGSASAPEEDRVSASGSVKTFTRLLLCAGDLFSDAKAEKHVYDYSDMEHMCLELFMKKRGGRGTETGGSETDGSETGGSETGGGSGYGNVSVQELPEPSELALSYRKKFSEIYVDEYQDTNMLQEYILRLISGECENGADVMDAAETDRPHLFMVGDMKQSIYAFRVACPELFLEKYEKFYDEDRDAETKPRDAGTLVRLNANFRSRKEVVDSVNMIFSKIMNEDTCGMPYGTNEYLNYGASYYPDSDAAADHRTEIVVIDPGSKEQKADKTVLEGYEILCRIKEMIASRFPVYDSELKALRPIKYSDICILMRGVKRNGGKLADVLRSGGVPVSDVNDGAGLFLHPEMRVIVSFMRIIDNPLNDIPLAAVLKNIYGFNGDDLLRIRLAVPERGVPFYRKMQKFAAAAVDGTSREHVDNGEYGDNVDAGERESAALTRAFLERLEYLRKESLRRPPVETVWECLEENGFLERVRALQDGGVAYSDLMRFIKIASEFEDNGGGSFCEFVRMLDALEKNGSVKASAPSGSGRNSVSICTIHTSKGLEYPVVILAEAGRRRNDQDEKEERMLNHKELGFGPCCYDPFTRTVYHSIMREAVRLRIERDSRAEEMRLLYVAMTRAREKLIITGIGGNFDKFRENCESKADPSGSRPMDYYTLGTDDYLTLLGMAAVCFDPELSRSCSLVPGRFAQQLLDGSSGGANGGEGDDGEGADDVAGDDSELFGAVLKFGLPKTERWRGALPGDAHDSEKPFCPSKVSVSELKRLSEISVSEEDAETAEERIPSLYGGNTQMRKFESVKTGSGNAADGARTNDDAARTGTLIHCCLEHVDFGEVKNIGGDPEKAAEYARRLVRGLEERKFFTGTDAQTIPAKILTEFIRSGFALRMADAASIMREIPFALDFPSGELLGEPSFAGNTTTVQGIIDCVCVYEDGRISLIDYKSDTVKERVRTGGREGSSPRDFALHSERYAIQLSVYAEVIERMFGKYPDDIELYYLKYGKEYAVPAEMTKRWKK